MLPPHSHTKIPIFGCFFSIRSSPRFMMRFKSFTGKRFNNLMLPFQSKVLEEMNAQELVQKHKLLECIQCGACTGSCPVARKANLNIRKYMREVATFGRLTQPPQNEGWSCTTCSTCGVRCPKDLNPYEFLIDVRGMAVEEGTIAPTIRDALESISKNGNPWARMRNKRSEWAQGISVKHISQGADILFYVG